MLGSEQTTEEQRRTSQTRNEPSYLENPDNVLKEPSTLAPHRLPAGTGPGTSGKPSTNLASEQEVVERNRASQGIAGYGTDAAAARGGLEGAHMGASTRDSGNKTGPTEAGTGLSPGLASASSTDASKRTSGVVGRDAGTYEQGRGQAIPATIASTGVDTGITETRRERPPDTDDLGTGRSLILGGDHIFGHSKDRAVETVQRENLQEEDTSHLKPIVHERVRHLETEEVSRVKELERHIHHIQHHTQPLIISQELPQEHRVVTHPVTRITETHTNKPEDNTFFEKQVHRFRDTLDPIPKERTIIDKGTVVKERIHHHIHHVVQPIIEKETIHRHYISTTIPIHEVTHEAPVVHQSQTHQAIPLEKFLEGGGDLQHGVPQDQITKKVLLAGQCGRDVSGVAESLERDLDLRESAVQAPQSSGVPGEMDDLAARKAAAGGPDRGARAAVEMPVPTQMPVPAPSGN